MRRGHLLECAEDPDGLAMAAGAGGEGSGVLRTTRRPATAVHPDQATFIDLDLTECRVAA